MSPAAQRIRRSSSFSGHIIVGTENVKIIRFKSLEHETDCLLRRPGGHRLLGSSPRIESSEDETGDQQMGAQPAAITVSQIVL